jgi:tetratricopeptide (TPR) repeat protein
LLVQFEAAAGGSLNPDDDRLVRLSKATIELAARRFAEADCLITENDANAERARTTAQIATEGQVVSVLADTKFGLQQWEVSLRYYDRLLELNKDSLHGSIGKGNCLIQLGRHRAALAHWESFLKHLDAIYQHGDRDVGQIMAAAFANRAAAIAGLGDLDGASLDLKAAINMLSLHSATGRPSVGLLEDLTKSRKWLASILADRGQFELALKELQAAEHDLAQAESLGGNEQMLRASIYSDLSTVYFDAGRMSDALAAVGRAIGLRGNSNPDELGNCYYTRAGINLHAGKLDAALGDARKSADIFQSAIKDCQPEEICARLLQSLRLRALIEMKKGLVEDSAITLGESVKVANQLLKSAKTDEPVFQAASSYTDYGDALREVSGPDKEGQKLAEAAFNRGISILLALVKRNETPRYALHLVDALLGRADSRHDLGKAKEARQDMDSAQALVLALRNRIPTLPLAQHEARCLIAIGRDEAEAGRVKEGLEYLTKAVGGLRENAKAERGLEYGLSEALYHRGAVHQLNKDDKSARADFQEAMALLSKTGDSTSRDRRRVQRRLNELDAKQ